MQSSIYEMQWKMKHDEGGKWQLYRLVRSVQSSIIHHQTNSNTKDNNIKLDYIIQQSVQTLADAHIYNTASLANNIDFMLQKIVKYSTDNIAYLPLIPLKR